MGHAGRVRSRADHRCPPQRCQRHSQRGGPRQPVEGHLQVREGLGGQTGHGGGPAVVHAPQAQPVGGIDSAEYPPKCSAAPVGHGGPGVVVLDQVRRCVTSGRSEAEDRNHGTRRVPYSALAASTASS